MNRACQSFTVGLGLSGSLNYGQCMVQYCTVQCLPPTVEEGKKKNLVVETRLIAVGCLLLWASV